MAIFILCRVFGKHDAKDINIRSRNRTEADESLFFDVYLWLATTSCECRLE